MNNTQRGRQALLNWEASKPDNFFTADTFLQRILKRYAPQADLKNLEDFGAASATIIDRAAKIEDRVGNHPRLERWSPLGERIEGIEFHGSHAEIGEQVWQSGIMALPAERGNNVEQQALFYLLAHNGEGGHCCSLACTFGLVKALQFAASDDVREKFLPPILSRDFETMQHGAQFLTEVQGGSDVGANAVMATDNGDGTWRISGEKWFCSNINADQFLLTARTTGEGTRGLGLFLVPRRLDDGTTNGFYLRRLKEKLGTRTMASAELDFADAVAYPVGDFKDAVELVLNTSRLTNAVASASMMRRAAIEAGYYACSREAFGQPIANYPLVQAAVADILTDAQAGVASSFYLAHLLDKIETEQASEDEQGLYRLLVNINKYITSIRGTEAIHRAIEVLGGNGAIESFSILPRLYRDFIVIESWEGTHNVLCLQVLRDITRYQLHEPFMRFIEAQLAQNPNPAIAAAADRAMQRLGQLAMYDENYAHAHIRRVVDLMGDVAQAALLQADAEPEIAEYFVNKRLKPDYDPMLDDTYLPRLERIMGMF